MFYINPRDKKAFPNSEFPKNPLSEITQFPKVECLAKNTVTKIFITIYRGKTNRKEIE